jgi:hypothetical protein
MDGGWVPTLVVRAASWLGDAAVYKTFAQILGEQDEQRRHYQLHSVATAPEAASTSWFLGNGEAIHVLVLYGHFRLMS